MRHSKRTRSIPWLLMPWLLTLPQPGHQRPWYWLTVMEMFCYYNDVEMGASCGVSCGVGLGLGWRVVLRMHLNCLRSFSVEEWYKKCHNHASLKRKKKKKKREKMEPVHKGLTPIWNILDFRSHKHGWMSTVFRTSSAQKWVSLKARFQYEDRISRYGGFHYTD